MVWRVQIDWLPDGDEARAEPLAHGRICHLDKTEDYANLHAYFEANEVPLTEPAPYMPDDPRRTFHTVSTAIVDRYPRHAGSVWDLLATMLVAADRGRPRTPGGLMLEDVPT